MSEVLQESIIELETKLAYQEDLLDALNEVVVKQQNQIDELNTRLSTLIKFVKPMLQSGSADSSSDIEPPPPHY